jgi:hypothetical protein
VPSGASISQLNAIDVTFHVVEVPSRAMVVDPVTAEPPAPNNPVTVAPPEASRRSRGAASPDRPIGGELSASASEPSEATPRPKLDPASAARAFVASVIKMGPIAIEAKHSRQSSKRMVRSYSMMDIARVPPSDSISPTS